MTEKEKFFSIIGPLGPETDFYEYEDYRDKTIKEMDLKTMLQGIRNLHIKYAMWPEDVEVAGIDYMRVHPEHRAEVLQAFIVLA